MNYFFIEFHVNVEFLNLFSICSNLAKKHKSKKAMQKSSINYLINYYILHCNSDILEDIIAPPVIAH
jgi:hypothetical protein